MAHTLHMRRLMALLQQARRANLKDEEQAAPVVADRSPRISRRSFLRMAVVGSMGLTAACQNPPAAAPTAVPETSEQGATPTVAPETSEHGTSPTAESDPNGATPRIAIIGGGIAGLHAAYQLKQAGYMATVYEARDRTGGRMHSVTGFLADDLVTDLGGSFVNTDHEDMLNLVDTFGLTLVDRKADAERLFASDMIPPVGYFLNGQHYTEAEMIELLRPLVDQITADADALDEDFDTVAAEFDQLSVADYLDQQSDSIPDPVVRTLIEQAIRSEYGVEPENASALELMFMLPTIDGERVELLGYSDEQFMVAGGTQQITQALTDALEGQIQLEQQLTRLEAQDSGFKLTLNDTEELEADYVIIAIPFTVLRQIPLEVELPEGLSRFIDEAHLGRNEKIIAGFSERVWHMPDGFAQDAWTDLSFPVVWDETQRQPEREDGALTLFFGGDQAVPTSDEGLKGLVEALETHLPGATEASTATFLPTAWNDTPFTLGSYTTFGPGQYTAFVDYLYIESDDPEERQDVYVDNLIFAGEHLSDAYYGFMNGGAETGRLAAEVVLQLIEEQSTSEEQSIRLPLVLN
ncbi:MAG: FAD-dependent oxidoreductase [Chloroflexaceae bacterium]|nr:FAD-dependent oxidoreductase [Chloroflexaceae bacterium]